MKILEPGKPDFAKREPFWVGMAIKCRSCGCAFQLEAADDAAVSTTAERTPNGRRFVYVKCPNCGTALEAKFERPAEPAL